MKLMLQDLSALLPILGRIRICRRIFGCGVQVLSM